jgi:hypothetical protein
MNRTRPAGLTAITIIGLMLGFLGVCGGSTSLVSLGAQDSIQQFSREVIEVSSQGDETLYRQQMEMQERTEALSASWKPALLACQTLNLLASFVLVAGCVMVLQWKRSGLRVLAAAVIASLVVDAGTGVVTMLYQLDFLALMEEHTAMMTAGDPALAGAERTMRAATAAGATISLLFALGWVVVKLAYYVVSLLYVRKPNVRELFASAPVSA